MADSTNHPDLLFDSQPESSGFANDDFEKVDAPSPSGGFGHDDVTAAASGAYEFDVDQDGEISTTADADFVGEEEVEADRFAGSHDEPAYPSEPEPLISWGGDGDNDEVTTQVQPSAPVPENNEPLVNFDDSSSGHDYMQSFMPSVPSSETPEPNLSSSSNPLQTQLDEFIEPKREESESVKEFKQDSDPTPVASAEVVHAPPATPSNVDVTFSVGDHEECQFEQTKLYRSIVKIGSWLKGVDPRVIDLIYWRDVKTTGMVFGTMFVVLLSLAIFSLMSVVAYLSLAVLVVTFSFTVYKKIMGAVQKSNEGHPFKQLIDMDIALSEDKLKSVIQTVLKNVNCTISELRRLFLIEDMVDSIKFGLLLWVLTYLGAWFNGMTLIMLVVVSIFTLPKVYETYKVQIDNYIAMAKAQVDSVMTIVQSKLPFLKKKEKAQ